MKKFAIAFSALAALTGTALAADLPVRPVYKAAPAPAPRASWTGCYVGGGGGYGMYNQDVSNFSYGDSNEGNSSLSGFGSDTVTLGGRGWFGTVQVGCDYEFMPNIVVGAFGDWDFGNIKGHLGGVDEKLKWSWAAGGRVGWVALPDLLAYVSGGFTQARFDQIDIDPGYAYVPATTYSGWFLGSGYEYRLSFFPGLYWKTEYRFADYKSKNLGVFAVDDGDLLATFDSHKYVQTIRSELVWRFNFY